MMKAMNARGRRAAAVAPLLAGALLLCAGAGAGAEGPDAAALRELLMAELGTDRALIINADDFGRDAYCNQGIIKGFDQGIVTAISIQTPSLGVDEAYAIIAERPDLDLGVHLILARDAGDWNGYGPLIGAGNAPGLVDDQGWFLTDIFSISAAAPDEIESELRAQVQAALDNGVDITHLNCHKGWCHLYQPKFTNPYLDLAAELEVPLRWTGRHTDPALIKRNIMVPDRVHSPKNTDDYEDKKSAFMAMIENLGPGITEIVMHPGAESPHPEEAWRALELRLALDPDVKRAIEEQGIALIGWRRLRELQRMLGPGP